MKTLWYSIVCEDIAHYFFLKRLLGFPNAAIDFQFNEACYNQYKCSNKKQVLNGYVDIANQAFRLYEQTLEMLIVIVDYDDETTPYIDYCKSLSDAVFQGIREKVVIAIPVQSIEHWLRYLQWKKDNPLSTKNESLEGENRLESKIKIYGSKKPSRDRTSTVIDGLLDSGYLSWLCQRSNSFNHFYVQIQKVLKYS
jgi:hypothetical protein